MRTHKYLTKANPHKKNMEIISVSFTDIDVTSISLHYRTLIWFPGHPSIWQSIQIVSCSRLHTDRWMPWIDPGNGYMSILLDSFTLLDKPAGFGPFLRPLSLVQHRVYQHYHYNHKGFVFFKGKTVSLALIMQSYFVILQWLTLLLVDLTHVFDLYLQSLSEISLTQSSPPITMWFCK